MAIYLLRAIDTAEVTYKYKHGGSLCGLVSEEFRADSGMAQLAKNFPDYQNAQFSKRHEILPEWLSRLNLTGGAPAYDLVLEDTTHKTCGYAAITDERGVIRQSKAIDCDI